MPLFFMIEESTGAVALIRQVVVTFEPNHLISPCDTICNPLVLKFNYHVLTWYLEPCLKVKYDFDSFMKVRVCVLGCCQEYLLHHDL